ncbi:helix-turn-helix transcriptional regulator [Streptomyces boninensis]|uniref:helix-turn-helix transcriptional regulator n=1 Tax=Streptomyces boninensis TaxID=2039455 RepID=UPI003B227D98
MPQLTAFDAPLVGREGELTRLTGLLERARAGEARALVIAGDAGVGKSRLLGEAADRAAGEGMTVFTGQCVDLGDVGLPYLPFTEILRALSADGRFAEALASHPAVDRLLGQGPGAGPADSGAERMSFFEDLAALLADLGAVAPLLLVIEDLHWADQSTRDLLRFLLSRAVLQRPAAGGAQTHRLAIFATYRSDDLHRRHPLRPLLAELVRLPGVERLELAPLSDDAVGRLVKELHGGRGGSLAAETVRSIVERAEGNAFYAEELLAAAADGGALPSGLADVLLIRLEQLSGTSQQVLRTAAVAGRRVSHELLREAADLPDSELEPALREAIGHQLLVSGERDTYTFRHALIREAVYEDLLPGERVRLHGVFAKLLEGRGRPGQYAAERAHHAQASHDLPGALTASLEAADHAQAVGAPAEELRHVEAALDLFRSVEPALRPEGLREVPLTLRASGAAARAGEAHRAVGLTRDALARLGSDSDAELAARVRYTLAGNLIRTDHLKDAFRYSSEALALIPADPPNRTWVWAAATHVMAANQVGDLETAQRVGRQALEVAEQLGVADAQADLIISLEFRTKSNRRTPEGRREIQRACDLARSAGNAAIELRALFNLAIGSYEAGELEQCLRWLNEGRERARSLGLISSPYSLEMRYLHLLVLYTTGRWDDCLAAADADTERLPAAGGFVAGPALWVAAARGAEDAVDRAQVLLNGPFDWMAALVGHVVLIDHAARHEGPEETMVRLRAGVAALAEEGAAEADPDATARLAEEGETESSDVNVRLGALALAAVADAAAEARLTGDEAAAARWTGKAAELAEMARRSAERGVFSEEPQGPEGQAWLIRAQAEQARAEGAPAAALWERAVAAFGGLGDVYEEARCERRLAEALLAEDRRDEAAEAASAARTTAAALRAAPLLADIDALIRRGRLGGAGEAAAAEREAVLTARERDVLQLLARGRTNRQIGEELYISGKTASVHVSNILAKLGAASRTEAVSVAYREGMIERETQAGS